MNQHQDLIKFLYDIFEGRWPNSPKEILHESLNQWMAEGEPHEYLTNLQRTQQGNYVFEYGSKGWGGNFVCQVTFLKAIETILKESERIYDEAAATYKPEGVVELDDEWRRCARDEGIRSMALIATRRLFIGIRARLCEAFEDNVEEAMLLAKFAFQGRLKMFFEGDYSEDRKPVDARQDIEKAVEKYAKRERERLTGTLSNVPALRVPKGRGGREPELEVTQEQCALLSQDYRKLLTHWKNVRRLHKLNPKGNWREHAKLDHPDTPDDLLDKVSSLDPYESTPSALAHEHAARRHGIPKGLYSLSTLTRLRRRGDKIRGYSKVPIE